MRPLTTDWRSILIRIAAAALFLALAIAEAMAADSTAPWALHLRQAEEALAQRNLGAARYAWQEAYGVALRSRRWEGLIEVGGAWLRIAEAAGSGKAAVPTARRLYATAFFLARGERSPEGVLVTADAFARLGDYEVAETCLRVAEGIARQTQDTEMSGRVARVRKRLAGVGAGEGREVGPLQLGDEDDRKP